MSLIPSKLWLLVDGQKVVRPAKWDCYDDGTKHRITKRESKGAKREARLPHVILQPDSGEKPAETDGRDRAARSYFRESTAFGAGIS